MKYISQSVLILSILIGISFQVNAQLTADEAVVLMQKGINLGNTLEPPLEGGWNNPPAQEYYFDLYKEAGFSTVRVPVRWDEHTQDSAPYIIDESWLQRVEQVIDWGLERDLFVIVNAHHEEWIKQGYANAQLRARFDSIWSQISKRFSSKSEKLLFEIINEPYGLTKIQNDDLHARILSIIRETNPTRLVIIQGHNWGGSEELIAAAIPDDEFLVGSFHSYDPYLFGLEGQGTWGSTSDYATLKNKFTSVKTWSESTGIPVLLGEFGAKRTADYNSRMKHYRAYVELSREFGFVSCAWDDGGDFRIMERQNHQWDEVKDILIHTTSSAPRNINPVVLDTLIKVNWTNAVTDADSVFVEHRIPTSAWKRIASVGGSINSFEHVKPGYDQFHHYRLIARYNSGEEFYSQPIRIFLPRYEPKFRLPFLGSPIPIPGIIEAEDFDIGGEGLSYHDMSANNIGNAYRLDEGVDIYSRNGDGFHIGSILSGEWCEYTVAVNNEGLYKADFYVAGLVGGGTFSIRIDTVTSQIITAPETKSRIVTKIVSDTLHLSAGEYIMRLTILDDNSSSFNIDKMQFSYIDLVDGIENNSIHEFTILSDPYNNIILKSDGKHDIEILQLFSTAGKLMYSISDPETDIPINTSALPSGIYIISIFTKHQHFTEKILFR